MSKREFHLVNFDVLAEKRQVLTGIQKLTGVWEIGLRPIKQRRSLDQNSYYFAAYVTPFRDWLIENWGEQVTLEQAHETLKLAVMEIPRVEGVAIMPSSKTLDTKEFSMYLEDAARFLAEKCSIVVLPAELYFEAPERGASSRKPKTRPPATTK